MSEKYQWCLIWKIATSFAVVSRVEVEVRGALWLFFSQVTFLRPPLRTTFFAFFEVCVSF